MLPAETKPVHAAADENTSAVVDAAALDEYTAGTQIDESELELAVPWALFTAPAPNATISIGEIALGDTRASGLDAASAVMLADQLARSRRLAQVRRLA